MFHVGAECLQGTAEVISLFEQCWVTWAGNPSEVYVDPGSEFTSELWATRMQESGTRVNMSATDAHWQLGRAEIHGSTIKKMLTRMDIQTPIDSSVAFQRALRQAFQAKNTLARSNGFTPQQAVLGIATTLPGSISSDMEAATHALADSETPEGQRFLASLKLREQARTAFIQVDNSASFRRALLRRTRPTRLDWETGDYVLYWRRKGGNLRREHGRWHGPGQIVSIERGKIIWISHMGKLIRASPEQVRAASLREWSNVEKDDRGRPLDQIRPLRERLQASPQFVDLEGEEVPTVEGSEETEDSEVRREPEEEAIPESGAPEDNSSRTETAEPDSNRAPEDEMDWQQVPLPEDGASEQLEFGDDVEMPSDEVLTCHFDSCWEIEIPIPDGFDLSEQVDEEVICLASESRKKRVEVRLRDMTVKDQRRFAIAKNKEVGAWLAHRTVKRVAGGKIPDKNIMRCRWIYTWKTAEATSEETKDGRKAKARLVVLGFEDPDLEKVPNDAPTLSKDGRQLVLQKICSNRWQLTSFDISTAFLHGKGDGRLLGIQAPLEVKEALGMREGEQCELVGGAYGRIDAPFLWYKELQSALKALDFKQCPLDPCVFTLGSRRKDGTWQSHGVLGIHVDDGICGGDRTFQKALEQLRAKYSFGSFETGNFVFTGIRMSQWDDGSIEMDQKAYVEGIDPIHVPRDRRKEPNVSVSEEERRSFRQLIGSLQYAAVHTRADLSAKVSELQSSVNTATVASLLEGNRVASCFNHDRTHSRRLCDVLCIF